MNKVDPTGLREITTDEIDYVTKMIGTKYWGKQFDISNIEIYETSGIVRIFGIKGMAIEDTIFVDETDTQKDYKSKSEFMHETWHSIQKQHRNFCYFFMILIT